MDGRMQVHGLRGFATGCRPDASRPSMHLFPRERSCTFNKKCKVGL